MTDPIAGLRDELHTHVKEDIAWKTAHDERWHQNDKLVKEVIKLQKQNAIQIAENTSQIASLSRNVDNLTTDTSGMVKLYNNIGGSVETAKGVQRFFLWVVKWAFIFTTLGAMITYLVNQPNS